MISEVKTDRKIISVALPQNVVFAFYAHKNLHLMFYAKPASIQNIKYAK